MAPLSVMKVSQILKFRVLILVYVVLSKTCLMFYFAFSSIYKRHIVTHYIYSRRFFGLWSCAFLLILGTFFTLNLVCSYFSVNSTRLLPIRFTLLGEPVFSCGLWFDIVPTWFFSQQFVLSLLRWTGLTWKQNIIF